MDLVHQLRRQTLGAGASVLAAVVLLVVATAVAASGGGLGGLGSLGQLTSGPELPDVGLTDLGAQDAGSAEIVGAQIDDESPAPSATGLPASGGGVLAGAPGLASTGVPGSPAPQSLETPVSPGETPSPVSPPSGEAPTTEPQTPAAPVPPPPNAVGQVIDDTRRLGESLPGPLGPVTGGILDLLLGPRR